MPLNAPNYLLLRLKLSHRSDDYYPFGFWDVIPDDHRNAGT
jgi:hypothetical protein